MIKIREQLYEKFSQNSDPIKDLKIGAKIMYYDFDNQFQDNYALVFKGKFFSDETEKVFNKCGFFYDNVHNTWASRGIKSKAAWLRIAPDIFKEIEKIPAYTVVWNAGIKDSFPISDYNNVNEKFSEDSDPIKDLGIGKQAIINELKDMGILEDYVEFMPDMTFFMKSGIRRSPEFFFDLQMKYFPENKKELMQDLRDNKKSDIKIIREATKNGISIEDLVYIVGYINPDRDTNKEMYMQIDLYKKFLNRNQEQKKFDKENNVYVFIGKEDKLPVEINGKKYYEDKFQAEKLVKIDKYDLRDIHSIEMMKHRAEFGRHGAVYMVTLPIFIMGDKYYEGIPEEWREIIDKYKKRI